MKTKHLVIAAIVLWLLWRHRQQPATDVRLQITEPGMEGPVDASVDASLDGSYGGLVF